MRHSTWFDTSLLGELVCLLLAAPCLYFPNWFPGWAPTLACIILFIGWIWRRWRLGVWLTRTPVDWAILFLFVVMLPVAVWVAPPDLREQYALPRTYILLWNFCLFWTVATHSSRSRALATVLGTGFVAIGTTIAVLAPLGIQWVDKMPGMDAVLHHIPAPLMGVFRGAESGFSPNQVAGALLYVLPLALIWTIAGFSRARRLVGWWLSLAASIIMLTVLVMTQSRAGVFGFVLGMGILFLLTRRWGRWALLAILGVALVSAQIWFDPLVEVVNGVPSGVTDSVNTLVSRQEIWSRAFYGIQDYSFTGMGLGTFRSVVWQLYPLFLTPHGTDIAHAHNFFLQSALDVGLPGLIALLVMYMTTGVQTVVLGQMPEEPVVWLTWNTWGIGLAGCLLAQTVYSQLDAVALGAKPDFLLWYLLALILGTANAALQSPYLVIDASAAVPQDP